MSPQWPKRLVSAAHSTAASPHGGDDGQLRQWCAVDRLVAQERAGSPSGSSLGPAVDEADVVQDRARR